MIEQDALLDAAALTHVGTSRDHNEDACGVHVEAPDRAVVAVADGVSQANAGEVASEMAIVALLRSFAEAPSSLGAGQRLYRAVQQANIEIYDRAIAVPELRGMSTTLTAAAVEGDEVTVVHVGDSRAYLLRAGGVAQITKDHTVVAERMRYGLVSKDRARTHPDRSVLTRSVGRELIVSRDRVAHPISEGDAILLCTDGVYGVLSDDELARLVAGRDAASACRAIVDAANARGTPDNLSAAVVRAIGPLPSRARSGLGDRLRRALGVGGGRHVAGPPDRDRRP